MKNNAILIAGKTKPTIGTKIDGKKVAAIFFIFNGFELIFSYISLAKSVYKIIFIGLELVTKFFSLALKKLVIFYILTLRQNKSMILSSFLKIYSMII